MAEDFLTHFAIGPCDASGDEASADLLREVLTAWQSALMEAHAGGVFRMVFSEVHHFPELANAWLSEVIYPARHLVSALVARGIDRGEFRPVDPDAVVHALVLPMLFMCLHRHAIGPHVASDSLADADERFSRGLELVVEGLMLSTPQHHG